jgi:YD repeat-containing protein
VTSPTTSSRAEVLFDSTGRTTTSYDALGQVTTLVWPGKTLTHTYNEAGQRATLRDPDGGRFTYSGRIQVLTNPQSEVTTYDYDRAGRRESTRRANATRSTLTTTTPVRHYILQLRVRLRRHR